MFQSSVGSSFSFLLRRVEMAKESVGLKEEAEMMKLNNTSAYGISIIRGRRAGTGFQWQGTLEPSPAPR